MPRDIQTPLIQKIAKLACITYRGLKSSADVADRQSELISLVTAVRAADLKIAPRKSKPSSGGWGSRAPPVTYMHICEMELFSMGVFLLRPGASTPLHERDAQEGSTAKTLQAPCLYQRIANSESKREQGRGEERRGFSDKSGISRAHQQIPSSIFYRPHPLCITHSPPSLPSLRPHKIGLMAVLPA
ncbi:unnamed protein product [Pleuronectes platessa]|uniref:Uncharacterized protein n=1 Tax=Pleuronectes platessa TaxID=8262 RepID=A0A9N7TWP3_PLEPL|nr:unnamed protein product [Pleuronectes platessa]